VHHFAEREKSGRAAASKHFNMEKQQHKEAIHNGGEMGETNESPIYAHCVSEMPNVT
jgi:hypothetical protein